MPPAKFSEGGTEKFYGAEKNKNWYRRNAAGKIFSGEEDKAKPAEQQRRG